MNTKLIWLPIVIAVADWIALRYRLRWLDFIAKPGVMIGIGIWVWSNRYGFSAELPLVLIMGAIIFSLLGDTLLMFPKERFLHGLISFFIAHLFYLVVLNDGAFPVDIASLMLAGVIIFPIIRINQKLQASLSLRGQTRMRGPVLGYSVLLALMLYFGLLTLVRVNWSPGSAWLVAFGALGFFLSDVFLGWDRFVAEIPNIQIPRRVLYQSGQIALLMGLTSHYLSG